MTNKTIMNNRNT